jgi:hypothetical protein
MSWLLPQMRVVRFSVKIQLFIFLQKQVKLSLIVTLNFVIDFGPPGL